MKRSLFDTGILGQLCHPRNKKNQAVGDWLVDLSNIRRTEFAVVIPEICDYELRRKLLHLLRKKQTTPMSLRRLDDLAMLYDYLPLDTDTMREAARLWAEARALGIPTADDSSLDGDMILAAQALSVGGTVVTTNPKHLGRFVAAINWTDV